MPAPRELSVNDFTFDGPLGSQGATIKRVGRNHFRVQLGHAPGHPEWCNKLQVTILRHAKGNALRLDVEFPSGKGMALNEYHHSYSYDGKDWLPVHWAKGYRKSPTRDTMLFPVFKRDRVFVGHQVPMSYEDMLDLIAGWRKSPYVTTPVLGKSLGGRDIIRVEVTDPKSRVPRSKRWVHYAANQHPGEHNSQWRMAGMVEWLLSDDGRDCLRRSICHFVLFTSPDAPWNGWYRVNAQGVDMNRSYFADGSHAGKQAHEACIVQRGLEELMASEAPVTTLWSMHTWGGVVEPILTPGPEMGEHVGPWTELRDIMERNDPKNLVKPLKVRHPGSNLTYWTSGPHKQFGISVVLCEGAGAICTKELNKASGAVIMKSLAEFYRGEKPG